MWVWLVALLVSAALSGLVFLRVQHIQYEFDRLYQSTREFLEESGLTHISENQIFPVYEEIQKLANK